MGINITISNSNISENAKVLGNAKLANSPNDNITMNIVDTVINGDAEVLKDLEISSVLTELEHQIQTMDKNSAEYLRLKNILAEKQWDKQNFLACIKKHLGEFSQGVFASILANLLTP